MSLIAFIIATFLLLAGCKDTLAISVLAGITLGSFNGEDSENRVEEGSRTIESSDVRYVAGYIAKSIENQITHLDPGNYTEKELPCWRGTLTISGVLSRIENESCGSGCTRSYNNHDLIVRFVECASAVEYSSMTYSITGEARFSNSMGIETIESGNSTVFGDLILTDNGSNIQFEFASGDSANTQSGIFDTITSLDAYESGNWISKHYLWDYVILSTNHGTYTSD